MKDCLKRIVLTSFTALGLAAIGGCGSMGTGVLFADSGGSGNKDDKDASAAAAVPPTHLITPQLLRVEKERRDKDAGADISHLTAPATPYTIESGDLISIVVWDHPELGAGGSAGAAATGLGAGPPAAPATFTVDQQGAIQFPHIGMLKIAGLTEQQARELLTSGLSYYLNKPNVTLSVQSYRSKRIYVDGEVKNPGIQTINDIPMSLVEAINRAGGFQPSGDQSQIILTRKGSAFRINLPQLVQRGVNPNDIMLISGDVLRVRSRDESKVFVSGEVIGPRALQMHNGRLSLSEALGESGGINPLTGDARQIYVVRKSASDAMVYQLSANNSGALALAEGFELEPKDIIYVAATPLTNWYRTISQIFPGGMPSPASILPAR